MLSGYRDLFVCLFIKQDETRALKFEIRATAFPEPNPKVIELSKDENVAHVRFYLFNQNINIVGKKYC